MRTDLPAAIGELTWSCLPDPGSSCTPGGSGEIVEQVTLSSGSRLSFLLSGRVVAPSSDSLACRAAVLPPTGLTDPDLYNNQESATVPWAAGQELIFADGFESGDMTGWSLVSPFTLDVEAESPARPETYLGRFDLSTSMLASAALRPVILVRDRTTRRVLFALVVVAEEGTTGLWVDPAPERELPNDGSFVPFAFETLGAPLAVRFERLGNARADRGTMLRLWLDGALAGEWQAED